MDEQQAYEIYSKWYNDCLEAGIEPEAIVFKMGGMALITDDALISELVESGKLIEYQ